MTNKQVLNEDILALLFSLLDMALFLPIPRKSKKLYKAASKDYKSLHANFRSIFPDLNTPQQRQLHKKVMKDIDDLGVQFKELLKQVTADYDKEKNKKPEPVRSKSFLFKRNRQRENKVMIGSLIEAIDASEAVTRHMEQAWASTDGKPLDFKYDPGKGKLREAKFTKVHAKKAMQLLKGTSADKVIPKGDTLYVNYTKYDDRAKIKKAVGKLYKYDNDGRQTNAPRGVLGLGGANWMSFINEGKLNESMIGIETKANFKPNSLKGALEKAGIKGFKMDRLTWSLSMLKLDKKDLKKAEKIIDALPKAKIKMVKESINEISVKAGFDDIKKGMTTSIDGVKMSKDMVAAIMDWMAMSAYGRKYHKQIMKGSIHSLLKPADAWGIERFLKSGKLKREWKAIIKKHKPKREGTNEQAFPNRTSDTFTPEEGDMTYTIGKPPSVPGLAYDIANIVAPKKVAAAEEWVGDNITGPAKDWVSTNYPKIAKIAGITEGVPFPQTEPNEFAYFDFKKWAYKNRGRLKKELLKRKDSPGKLWETLSRIWEEWAKRTNNKEFSRITNNQKFGRALAIMLKKDNVLFSKNPSPSHKIVVKEGRVDEQALIKLANFIKKTAKPLYDKIVGNNDKPEEKKPEEPKKDTAAEKIAEMVAKELEEQMSSSRTKFLSGQLKLKRGDKITYDQHFQFGKVSKNVTAKVVAAKGHIIFLDKGPELDLRQDTIKKINGKTIK